MFSKLLMLSLSLSYNARSPTECCRGEVGAGLFHVLLTRTHIRGQCARSALQPVLTGGISEDMGEGKRARRYSEPAASVQSLDLLYSSSPLVLPHLTLLLHLLLILIPCLLSFVPVPDEIWCHLTSSVSIGRRTTDPLSFIKRLLLLVLPSQTVPVIV